MSAVAKAPWRRCLDHVRKKVGRRVSAQSCCVLECGHTITGKGPSPVHRRRRCYVCKSMGTRVCMCGHTDSQHDAAELTKDGNVVQSLPCLAEGCDCDWLEPIPEAS